MTSSRPLLRRIPGVQKVLSRDRRRVGTGYVMHYPSSDRIEISWSPAGVDSGGAVGLLYTRDQALQLVDEVLDLLGLPEVEERTVPRLNAYALSEETR